MELKWFMLNQQLSAANVRIFEKYLFINEKKKKNQQFRLGARTSALCGRDARVPSFRPCLENENSRKTISRLRTSCNVLPIHFVQAIC